ncbi:MAG: GIY-YIG nuclease family protein [Erysipelotrichaceae bacterium]|nr:GIY-YIG nuclease family protein [Erysipelotrichaceae bacterium]
MKENIVYMLKCNNQSYYTGWTNDFIKRMTAHQRGNASHYTHAFPPVEIVYIEVFKTKNEALRKEVLIKQMNKIQKQEMILQQSSFTQNYLSLHPFEFKKRDNQ